MDALGINTGSNMESYSVPYQEHPSYNITVPDHNTFATSWQTTEVNEENRPHLDQHLSIFKFAVEFCGTLNQQWDSLTPET